MPKPKNEHAVCAAVKQHLSEIRNQPFSDVARPEQVDRVRKAVEEVFRVGNEVFAVEHTRIGSLADRSSIGSGPP